MVHEQNFKGLHISPERRVLDLESDARGSLLTGGNILLLDFLFSCGKASDANIDIVVNFI